MLIETSPKGFAPDWLVWKAAGGWAADSKEGSLGDYDVPFVSTCGLACWPRTRLIARPCNSTLHRWPALPRPWGVCAGKRQCRHRQIHRHGPVGFSAAMLPLLASLESPALATARIEQQPPAADMMLLQPVAAAVWPGLG